MGLGILTREERDLAWIRGLTCTRLQWRAVAPILVLTGR